MKMLNFSYINNNIRDKPIVLSSKSKPNFLFSAEYMSYYESFKE